MRWRQRTDPLDSTARRSTGNWSRSRTGAAGPGTVGNDEDEGGSPGGLPPPRPPDDY